MQAAQGRVSGRWLTAAPRRLLTAVLSLTLLWSTLLSAIAAPETDEGRHAKSPPPSDPVPELPKLDDLPADTPPADMAQGKDLLPKQYACLVCHSEGGELWTKDMPVVTEEDLAGDVHWQAGIRCHDCHGGSLVLDRHDDHRHIDHRHDDSFRSIDRENIPALCGSCHEKEHRVYVKSVHFGSGGEVGAACSDCHGSHGMFPATDKRSKFHSAQVVHTCGTCHARVAELFENTRMKHRFEQEDWVGLPGCTVCHSNHHIHSPTEAMLGTKSGAVCINCHRKQNKFRAPLAGFATAKALRAKLGGLDRQIKEAKAKIKQAKHLGLEVRGPRFDLMQAEASLTDARSLIHTFSVEPVEEALGKGRTVADDVTKQAEDVLRKHSSGRIWLAISLMPLLIVVVLLPLYIRTMRVQDP